MSALYFLPYLLVYLVAWAAHWPTHVVLVAFTVGHVLAAAGLASWVWRNRVRLDWQAVLPWLLAAFAFWVPGAYLEYPSDALEHARRIGLWEGLASIDEHPVRLKFAYFWGWTFWHWLPVNWRPVFFDLYSAFWQLLMAGGILRLSRAFGVPASRRWLHVLGWFLFFGNNVFSFRYYALASTALAYVAYLEAFAMLVEKRKRHPELARYAGLLLLMVFNHAQEPLLMVVVGAALLTWHYLPWSDRRVRIAALVLLLGGLAAAPLFAKLLSVPTWLAWTCWRLYLEIVTLPGLLALFFSFYRRDKWGQLAWLSWFPLLLLCYPPTADVIRRILPTDYSTMRVLYAMPISLLIVEELWWIISARAFRKPLAITAFALLVLAVPHRFPWRGKLGFQLYRVHSMRRLEFLLPTAVWLQQNRAPRERKLLTDMGTRMGLESYLGGFGTPFPWQEGYRTNPSGAIWLRLHTQEGFRDELDRYRICRVLLLRPDQWRDFPHSRMGGWSGHWVADSTNKGAFTDELFQNTLEALVREGQWTRVEVPPNYYLYESSTERCR